ncbi:hypothetical protein D5S17_17515 [Pseudonocardiaceae bacterium YIM PH 21723]|nr:hypothetical protein D5S17_17515 [Pseudonocardiaceae bacterium YIM PH 21723]
MDTSGLDRLCTRWPAGETKLHVYFVPDPAQITPLAHACRPVIDELPCLARQPDVWLHATMMAVDGTPGSALTGADHADLAGRLHRALAGVESFEATCDPATVGPSSVSVRLVPENDFAMLSGRV